jgi:hypothetical protein
MKLTSTQKSLLLGILPFLLIFSWEPLYRDSLFQKTLHDVPRMQLKKRLHGFFNAISMVGEAQVAIVVLVAVFNLTNKMKALYIWAAFGFVCYINIGILKQLYAEPRPFWMSDDIHP